MKEYESMVLISSSIPEKKVESVISFVEENIKNMKGEVIKKEVWGMRKLAYEIKKEKLAYYVLFIFKADGTTISEFNRELRLNDKILRHATLSHLEIEEIRLEEKAEKKKFAKLEMGSAKKKTKYKKEEEKKKVEEEKKIIKKPDSSDVLSKKDNNDKKEKKKKEKDDIKSVDDNINKEIDDILKDYNFED